MDDAALARRSRRAILAGALGGIAATVLAAIDRPRPAAADHAGDFYLGHDNTTTGETKIINDVLEAPGSVFTAQTVGDVVAVRGYSNAGIGVRGDSVGAEGVVGTSSTSVAVKGKSAGGIGVHGDAESHYEPAMFGWHRGNGIGIVGYENYLPAGGVIPSILQDKIGVYGRSEGAQGIGVKGESASGAGVRGVGAGPGVYGSSANDSGVKGESTNGVGVEGTSGGSQGIGVYGQGQAAGLFGTSGTGRGVQATSESSTAVHAVSQTQTAIFGFSGSTFLPSAPTKVGVFGHAQQDSSARGVYGRTTVGKGVLGEATTGVGVQALATTGVALAVSGRATFSRSGRTSIPRNRNYFDITVPGGLASTASVIATLQTYRSGVWVAACRTNYPSAGKVRIYLNKVASTTASTTVAWMAIG